MFHNATSITYSIEYVVRIYKEHVEEIEEVKEEQDVCYFDAALVEQFREELARRMSHVA